jgi:periplasmic divalent cation tolerance protein
MSEVVVVLSTVPDDESAERIARTLVDEKLVACVNLLPPMTSIYRWKGTVEKDTERQLVMKTTQAQVGPLKKRLRELHSYELPEFLVLGVAAGDPDYLSWVTSSLK